jgi:thymidylate kinase
VETGLKRTFDEEGDKRERKGIAFFEKAYAWYQQLAHFGPTQKLWKVIDAQGSIDEVGERVKDYVIQLL